jgi:hypothetical protein
MGRLGQPTRQGDGLMAALSGPQRQIPISFYASLYFNPIDSFEESTHAYAPQVSTDA